MKNKAPLALMEQLIMLLVFALAAALCLQVFVYASQVSRQCETRSNAAEAVQNAAEITKTCQGNTDLIASYLGGSASPDGWQLFYDADWEASDTQHASFRVLIAPEETDSPALGGARIRAVEGTETLFEIAVYWQEEILEQR